jgi:hypothetical protein
MSKLVQRYTPEEMTRLTICMKPVEKWSRFDREMWAQSHYGFRHFIAPNVVPIEHFMPAADPFGGFAQGRADAKPRSTQPSPRSSPPRSPPPPKPAA